MRISPMRRRSSLGSFENEGDVGGGGFVMPELKKWPWKV